MKNDLQFVPQGKETKIEFLLLVNRSVYRARFVTSNAVHLAEAGEWDIEVKGEGVIVSFPRARIIDPQNRGWITRELRVCPVNINIPYGYPVFVSSPGVHARYYIPFPRACSLMLESVVPVGSK